MCVGFNYALIRSPPPILSLSLSLSFLLFYAKLDSIDRKQFRTLPIITTNLNHLKSTYDIRTDLILARIWTQLNELRILSIWNNNQYNIPNLFFFVSSFCRDGKQERESNRYAEMRRWDEKSKYEKLIFLSFVFLFSPRKKRFPLLFRSSRSSL